MLKNIKMMSAATKIADISLCSFIAEHNLPYRTMDHLCLFMKNVLRDSKIAHNIYAGRTKTRTVIVNVIGETHKKELTVI